MAKTSSNEASRVGMNEDENRLIQRGLIRLDLVGSRSGVLKLPQPELEALCQKLLKPGAVNLDIYRSLTPAARRKVTRSAFYRFRTDLLWSIDSLGRGQPIPEALREFKRLGDRGARRCQQHNGLQAGPSPN